MHHQSCTSLYPHLSRSIIYIKNYQKNIKQHHVIIIPPGMSLFVIIHHHVLGGRCLSSPLRCVPCNGQTNNKKVYDYKWVGSCWRNSACLCVLWSYNKQWSNGIIISYISFIHTSPRHTDLRQLQGRRDKKRHEPSIIIYHGLSH